ncbi:PREDICTED: polygalacturonase At1g48100-like [Camelina sativa]|uniref:Polygalacturonase At1g48100-like n=1 Tax=Camelina sativa TaxID=90675 RepID=A0ABM0WMI2_CAMSA|nr:PREDICTED: polygalacturonase At1g48100-like [Camelina sativa]
MIRRKSLRLRSITMTILVSILVWSTTLETCIARRGRHLRHHHSSSSSLSNSLSSKKPKGHDNNSHSHKSKPKPKPKPKMKSPPPKSDAGSPVVSQPPQVQQPPPHVQPPPPSPLPLQPVEDSQQFNVLDFGAKGDGMSDDTQAFEAAWASACKVEASTMVIPPDYIFLVGPISFSGPYCQANIVFQLDGMIVAPTDTKSWGRGLLWWIEFTKLKGITIQGKGVIDGRGTVWWQQDYLSDYPIDDDFKLIVPLNNSVQEHPPMPIRSELSGRMPSIKPTALRFYGSIGVTVTGVTIQNSPQCHLKFDNCVQVLVHDVNVSSPGDSPNTDGIHLQNSKDVMIHTSTLACGDDCISIQTGCSNVYVHNVNCGPGHGISIGSLGKDSTKACVSNITVRDVVMHNTMTGVRIKTWQGGIGSVKGILFSNIQLTEVQLPIVIDQFYCDHSKCMNQTSAVSVEGVTYEKIRGTYTVKPVHFACSDSFPCIDVQLSGIELKPVQLQYHMSDPFCWKTFGELTSTTVPPIDCLQIGKPARNGVHSDRDICL